MAKEYLVEVHGRFLDEMNDDSYAICGECHHFMDVVRPGKFQCNICDTDRVFDKVLDERNELREFLQILLDDVKEEIKAHNR